MFIESYPINKVLLHRKKTREAVTESGVFMGVYSDS